MPSKRLTAAERKQTIVDAGRSVFLEVGLEGSRTITIAQRAGINEAMIYKHFPSKDAIFEESVLLPMQRGLSELAARAEGMVSQHLTGDEAILALEGMWLDTVTAIGPYLSTALLSDRVNGQATYRSIVLPALKRIDAVVASLIHDPQTRSSWTITRALFGANLILGLMVTLESGQGQTPEELASQVGMVLVNGLTAP